MYSTSRFSRLLLPLLAALLLSHGNAIPVRAQTQASIHYEAAVMKFNEDDLEASLLELKTALNLNPDLLPARILLARIFLKIGDGTAAEAVVSNARRLGADPALFWPIRAEALFVQLKFKELLALVPESGLPAAIQSRLLVFRGRASLELGHSDDAEDSFKAAIELSPLEAPPRVWLASVSFRSGDLTTAETRAKSATMTSPEDPEGWNILGSVAHARGKFDQALNAYDRALKLKPEHLEARVSRAGLLIDLQRVDQAGKDIEYLRKQYSLDPRGAYLESVYLSKRGEPVKAREALARAAGLLANMNSTFIAQSAQLQLLAGIANYDLGSYERAQAYLRQYIERLPKKPGPRKLLAKIMIQQQRATEAIRVLEPVLKYAPRDSHLLLLLGTAWMQIGRHAIATGYLEKAAALKSDSPEVLTRLALSRLGAGDEKRGIQELDELFTQDSENYQSAGIQLAITYLKRGRAQDAILIAKKLRQLNPENLTVLNFLASAQLSEGLIDEARLNYEDILDRDPDFMPALINLAQLTTRQGNIDSARDQFNAILEKHPANVRTMLELAKLERSARHLPEALRWLNKALDAKPKSMPAVLELMALHQQMGKAQEALRLGMEAQSWAPENLQLLAEIARSQVALDRQDIARDLYNKMSRIARFDTAKLYRIAQLQITANALADALFSLRKGMKTEPMHLPSRVLVTKALRQSGKFGEALEHATAIIMDFPEQTIGHQLLGDVQFSLGRYPQALDSYRMAHELRPGSAINIKLYEAGTLAGSEPTARQLLIQWVNAHPEDEAARKVLADGLLAAGELAAAEKQYRQLLSQNPNNVYAINNLANTLDRSGHEDALEHALRAHKLAPDDPVVSDTLGWILVRTGQPAEGLKYLRDAHSRISGNPEIRLHIASALVDLGRNSEARKELKALLKSNKRFAGIETARQMLEKLELK